MYRLLYIPEAKYVSGIYCRKKEYIEYIFTVNQSLYMPVYPDSLCLNLKENKNLFEIVEVDDYV